MAQWIPALFLKALLLQAAAGDLCSAEDDHCTSQVPVSEAAQGQVLMQRGAWSTQDAAKASTAEESSLQFSGLQVRAGLLQGRTQAQPEEDHLSGPGKLLVSEDSEEQTKEESGGGREGPGFTADLDEAGYQVVGETCCNYQMEEFIRRVIDDLGLELCGEGGLMGVVPYFSCDSYKPPTALVSFDRLAGGKAVQDFTTLRSNIVDSATSECPIAAGPGSCPSDSSTCPGVPDPAYHRRRNCRSGYQTTFTSTTTSGPTTTTTTTTERITTTKTTTTITATTTTRTATTTTTTTLETTTVAETTTTVLEPATTFTTTTTTTTSTGCKGETDVIDMFETELVQSNLGGAGPDFGFAGMRFEDAGIHEGQPYDMVVTATSDYTPVKSMDNGYECGQPREGCTTGHFAQISVTAGTQVDLTIEFQDSATQKPMTLSSFMLSFHDIDRLSAKVEEVIYITGFTDAVILDDATEVVSTVEADGRTKLTSKKDGTACDDPEHPDRLASVTCSGVAIDQKKRSAAFLFKDTSSIALSLEVTCNDCTAGEGRDFRFAGETNLVSCTGKH